MIICAGNNETFEFATPIGIGMIESAINLTRMALFDKPDFLIFIGSAGSYGKHEIFDIVESSVATNIENSFWSGGSYTPIDNALEAYHDNQIVSRETKHLVNSSNYITTDPEVGKQYLSHGIALENMEFFSVLRVAKEFEIHTLGIFIVTNYCDQNAHQDFLTHHEQAKQLLTEYLFTKYKALKK